jgi:hypothetical protein
MFVSQPPEPVPQRIGDAERDQAVELLREHLAAGRLDREEFEERIERALTARTLVDLLPLFADLPGSKPGETAAPNHSGASSPPSLPAMTPSPALAERSQNRALSVAAAVAWPLTIMVCFMIGWRFWWLIFIPIAISSIAGSRNPRDGGR